jgi:hypothetical protein
VANSRTASRLGGGFNSSNVFRRHSFVIPIVTHHNTPDLTLFRDIFHDHSPGWTSWEPVPRSLDTKLLKPTLAADDGTLRGWKGEPKGV